MATARITSAGALVELDPPNRIRYTSAGALVEIGETASLRITSAGALVEVRPPPPDGVEIGFAGVALAEHVNHARLEAILQAFDCTVFDSQAEARIPTTAAWAFPVGGAWSPGLDAAIGPLALRGEQGALLIRIGPVYYYWLTAQIVDYSIDSAHPAAGLFWAAALAGSGPPARITPWED